MTTEIDNVTPISFAKRFDDSKPTKTPTTPVPSWSLLRMDSKGDEVLETVKGHVLFNGPFMVFLPTDAKESRIADAMHMVMLDRVVKLDKIVEDASAPE